MNGQIDLLVRSLLQKDSLEQCSLQELEQFANRHPYFGAAQLLLTKKLQVENSTQYEEQLQKTYLFFHNPLWVQKLLNDTGSAEITVAERKEEVQELPQKKVIPEIIADTLSPEPQEQSLPEQVEEQPAAPLVIENEEVDANEEQTEIISAGSQPESFHEVEKTMASETTQEITPLPGLQVEPIDPAKAEMVFEPFHTVDYFASQGIRIKEEEKPKDKFGQQLRSFTDWLKTMKRLPVTEMTAQVEPAAEKKVEQLAEHSLTEPEVITEAMAEVWEKQGNMAKAIEIYGKLSLLDPAKSRYFAAKIEDLKK